jgi:hypothetical protein
MHTAIELRAKRNAAGIPGFAVAERAGIPRSRLCDLELGHIKASEGELERIDGAIDGILAEKKKISRLAEENGLKLAGIRL